MITLVLTPEAIYFLRWLGPLVVRRPKMSKLEEILFPHHPLPDGESGSPEGKHLWDVHARISLQCLATMNWEKCFAFVVTTTTSLAGAPNDSACTARITSMSSSFEPLCSAEDQCLPYPKSQLLSAACTCMGV